MCGVKYEDIWNLIFLFESNAASELLLLINAVPF